MAATQQATGTVTAAAEAMALDPTRQREAMAMGTEEDVKSSVSEFASSRSEPILLCVHSSVPEHS